MATLKDLFEENSQDIYKRFSPSREQPVVIKPDTNGVFGSNSRIKNDTRSIPTVSVLRDTRRVSRFLTSSDGLLFTAKQALLQTGNIFENTRIYNPTSPLLNVIPFVHARRHIPTQVITSVFLNPNASGLLQVSTVNNIVSKFEIVGKIQSLSIGDRNSFIPSVLSIAKTYLGTQLKNAIKILPSAQNYYTSRPEYKSFGYVTGQLVSLSTGPVLYDPQPLSQRGIPKLSVIANIKNKALSLIREESIGPAFLAKTFGRGTEFPSVLQRDPRNGEIITPQKYEQLTSAGIITNPSISEEQVKSFTVAAAQFKQKFYTINGKRSSRLKSRYLDETESSVTDLNNPINPVFLPTQKGGTGLRDPYNILPNRIPDSELAKISRSDQLSYYGITGEQKPTDIVRFMFSNLEGEPVQFRALISSIKESVKPEFTEQRYVGRTERFVTYGGAKRSVSLNFNVVAFSNDELDGMWQRVNYLSGLAFPKGVVNGFMVPPLFKITVGNLYDNQPCYLENLDFDFLDETITFDVDKEVPFAINVNMQLSILEKRSKFYDSPFYKIVEDMAKQQVERRDADRINQRISQG